MLGEFRSPSSTLRAAGIAALLLTSCNEQQRQTYSRLKTTYQAFARQYPDESPSVELRTDRYLFIHFFNSKLNDGSEAARLARVREAVALAIRTLDTGSVEGTVTFLRRRDFLVANITTPVAAYPFTADASGKIDVQPRVQ